MSAALYPTETSESLPPVSAKFSRYLLFTTAPPPFQSDLKRHDAAAEIRAPVPARAEQCAAAQVDLEKRAKHPTHIADVPIADCVVEDLGPGGGQARSYPPGFRFNDGKCVGPRRPAPPTAARPVPFAHPRPPPPGPARRADRRSRRRPGRRPTALICARCSAQAGRRRIRRATPGRARRKRATPRPVPTDPPARPRRGPGRAGGGRRGAGVGRAGVTRGAGCGWGR